MEHENEYHHAMVQLLELIWGTGYMAPGGAGSVAKMLDGLEPEGKHILDIGCGIGGPALEMAATYQATVVGVDLEQPLLQRASNAAIKSGLSASCTFQQVEPGPLPFDENSFDIVSSAGAMTQIENKPEMFKEIIRVLRPGGWITLYDWMKTDGAYSNDMLYWFKMEGLTYAMVTLEQQTDLLCDAGFQNVETTDATDWYRQQARKEYELLQGSLKPEMIDLIGQSSANHFIENWRAMVTVIDNNEMRQGYFKGRKPTSF